MKPTVKKLLMPGVILALMLAALPSVAAPIGEDPAAEMVKVVTRSGPPADCLAAIAVNKIDGELRAVPAQGFLVEPGVHTINGRATLDASKCQSLTAYQQIGRATDLEVNFEPGRIYYIAYDHKSQNTEEWRLVVWKVESDNPPQTFIQ